MSKLRVLTLSGTPYDMGYAHGKHYHDEIHMFTEDRIKLSQSPHWTGKSLSREAIIDLAEQCVTKHIEYAPDLMEELKGMADATNLSLAELIIMNGFTDFIDVVYHVGEGELQPVNNHEDNCTAFLVPPSRTQANQGMFGQTWDMHETATPYVMLLDGKPDNALDFLSFTITGCVGMIGMNEAGIAVGINNLMASDGQIGVTWNFVIRKILQQDNIEDALKCITDADLAGAHNYMLMDKNGNGYNVEAMSTHTHVEKLTDSPIVHTNHCIIDANQRVERERTPASRASTLKRYDKATTALSDGTVTPDDLMELTRDESSICMRPVAPMHVESCGAAIMSPATGDFWAVWGLPSENEYEHFTI